MTLVDFHYPADASGDLFNKEARQGYAALVVQLFDKWSLSNADQLELLGLRGGSPATLARYRKGEPLAASRDLLERVGHLLAIHKSLRLYFPENPELRYAWMTRPNRDFDNLTPIDVVRRFGFAGLLMVRSYLDKIRGE